MIMYLLLAMFPVILTPIVNSAYKASINKNDRAKKTFLLCCGAVLFFMIAFRNQYVGTVDSHRYYNNWLFLRDLPRSMLGNYLQNSEMDTGYLVVVWALSHIFPNPQFVFIFSAILFVIAVCNFIYKNSEDVCLSVVMFVCLGLYTFMVQGLRQAVAMCICLFALELYKNKKYVRFVLLVLLATLFHKTAIIFLLVGFLRLLKMEWKSYTFVGLASATVLAGSGYIVEWSKVLFKEETYTTAAQAGGFIATAIYVLILVVSFIFATKKQKKEDDFTLFFYITYMGFFSYLLRYVELAILERISYYFLFGQIILLPKILGNFDNKVRNIVKTIVIILCVLLLAYRLSTSDLTPFVFFWQDHPNAV